MSRGKDLLRDRGLDKVSNEWHNMRVPFLLPGLLRSLEDTKYPDRHNDHCSYQNPH